MDSLNHANFLLAKQLSLWTKSCGKRWGIAFIILRSLKLAEPAKRRVGVDMRCTNADIPTQNWIISIIKWIQLNNALQEMCQDTFAT